MKVLIHDGQRIWLACRRLQQGRQRWAEGSGSLALSQAQFDALVLGLPWQQLGDDDVTPCADCSWCKIGTTLQWQWGGCVVVKLIFVFRMNKAPADFSAGASMG